VPAHRDVLYIRWKDEVLDRPFFCDVSYMTRGGSVLKEKAFLYAKYRDIFVRLGHVAGFKMALELYQLRRASGKNINSRSALSSLLSFISILIPQIDAVTPEERNQTIGHHGGTYEKYYIPTHIARDYQSIYFGTPSQDLLIQSVARIGLLRDQRASTELNDN